MEQSDAMGIETGTTIKIVFEDGKNHYSTKIGKFKGLTGNLLVFKNQDGLAEAINIDKIIRVEEIK